jgi:hypothetical protein
MTFNKLHRPVSCDTGIHCENITVKIVNVPVTPLMAPTCPPLLTHICHVDGFAFLEPCMNAITHHVLFSDLAS